MYNIPHKTYLMMRHNDDKHAGYGTQSDSVDIKKALHDLKVSTKDKIMTLLNDDHSSKSNVTYESSSKRTEEDNRRIDIEKQNLDNFVKSNIESVQSIKAYSGEVYIIPKDNDTVVYIPDNIFYLNKPEGKTYFANSMSNIHGNIAIVGGDDVKSLDRAFAGCKFDSLDLTLFRPNNAESMEGMFYNSTIQSIVFGSFDTSKINDMSRAFSGCTTDILDLSIFNTANVQTMSEMFKDATISTIILKSFDTKNVKYMKRMFNGCNTNTLDLRNFKFDNTVSIEGMFSTCNINSVDIRGWDITDVQDKSRIFDESNFELLTYNDDTRSLYDKRSMTMSNNKLEINQEFIDKYSNLVTDNICISNGIDPTNVEERAKLAYRIHAQ